VCVCRTAADGVVNLVVWLHMLSGPCWCVSAALQQTHTRQHEVLKLSEDTFVPTRMTIPV